MPDRDSPSDHRHAFYIGVCECGETAEFTPENVLVAREQARLAVAMADSVELCSECGKREAVDDGCCRECLNEYIDADEYDPFAGETP